MAKTVTASPMTDGQIENVVAKLRDALRKHRNEFGSESVQQVLGVENLGMELLAPFRQRVEAVSNLIVRRVKVNRTRTPQAALDATGRKQYTDQAVVDAMPRGEGDEAEVVFFKPDASCYKNGLISMAEVDRQYELRGLVPDPYATEAVNEADSAFADLHPNAVQWQAAGGGWCCAAFDGWHGERDVDVNRRGSDWSDGWEFSGVRK